MRIDVDGDTGSVTFTASEGMAICPAGERGPTKTTTLTAPRGTLETSFIECEYDHGQTNYSVRAIIRELRKIGKLSTFRSFLESTGLDWDFVGANYLASTDEDFVSMCAAVVTNGIITQNELDEMLPKCLWSED